MVDISGLSKARVLMALYSKSKVIGLGIFADHAVRDVPLTIKHFQDIVAERLDFDYLYGRSMKIDISEDQFDERLYDRDHGEGIAQVAIDELRLELLEEDLYETK